MAARREPARDVQHVQLRERLVVGLGAVGVLVGPVPERLHGRHPELGRAADVLEEPVADEERVLRLDLERLERALEDRRVRLAHPDLRGEDAEVEPLREAHLLEVVMQERARVERVRDEPELEPHPAQRLQQRVGVRAEHARRVPRAVLGLEEARRAAASSTSSSKSRSRRRTSCGYSISSIVPGAQKSGSYSSRKCSVSSGRWLLPDRREPGAVAGRDQLGRVHELHQRVAPVEEDCLQHGWLG